MPVIDIVGGGILGLALGYDLIKRGVGVRIWERSRELGGLMGRTRFDELNGLEVDRYYHAILSSDRTLMRLFDELGLRSELRMTVTSMGFYHKSKLYSMSTPLDFLRFPPLSPIDRFRLGLTILQARRGERLARTGTDSGGRMAHETWRARNGGAHLEAVAARQIRWRVRQCAGNIHLVASGAHDRYPRKGRRRGEDVFSARRIRMVIDALAKAITARGGQITTGVAVQQVRVNDGRVCGLRLSDGDIDSDGAILTLQTPIARRLLPPEAAGVNARWSLLEDYLGIVCLLLVLRRSLSPYYTLNITDERIPFTGVIETTNLIDRQFTNGYHLVYLPKYVASDNLFAQMNDEALQRSFLVYLRQMFPDLGSDDIAAVRIGRERYVEPLHPIGRTDDIPPFTTDIAGLYLVNSSQIYPQLTNGEAAVAHATRAAEVIEQAVQSLKEPQQAVIA